MRHSRKERIALLRAEMRRSFEEERDEILATIPSDYKAMFGQIGFTKWGKSLIPVLILSPYRLPNNVVRQQWLAMFKKLRDQDRLDSMSYAVCFYGTDNANQCYGFVERKKFISYEREEAKGESKSVAKLPAKIQKKIDNGEDLSKKEQEAQRSYAEMEEDLLKDPSKRLRGVVEWLEDFEILEDHELVSGDDEEEEDSEAGDVGNFHVDGADGMAVNADDDDTPKVPAKKKRVGKGKIDKVRRKKKILQKPESPSDGNASEDLFDAETLASRNVEKPAKGKKDRKERSSAKEDRASDIGFDASTNELEEQLPIKKKRGRPPKKLPPQEDAPEEEQQCDAKLKDKEATSESPKNKQRGRPRKEPRSEESPEPEEDWADGEAMPAAKSSKKKKRGRPKVASEDNTVLKKKKRDGEPATSDVDEHEKRKDVPSPPTPVKFTSEMNVDSDGIGEEDESDMDEKEILAADEAAASADDDDFEEEVRSFSKKPDKGVKESVAKKSQKVKHKEVRPQTEQRKKRYEKEALAQCEESYLHLIEQWISAVQKRSVDLLRQVLTDVGKVVGEFSATFTFGYGIAVLMKETKSVLHDANAEAEIKMFTLFRKKVKDSYNTKNALVPKDYKPMLKFPEIAERANKPFAAKGTRAGKDLEESQDSRPSSSTHTTKATKNPPSSAVVVLDKSSAVKQPPMGHSQQSKPCTDGTTARAAAPVLAKRKTFSLTNMLRPKPEPTAVVTATSHNNNHNKSSAETNARASGPAPWWKVSTSLEAPKEDPRALALEFFRQMGEHFETGAVDPESLARSLEAAVYDWSQKKNNNNNNNQWTTVYWDKVYALTAAICGKEAPGSLMRMIAQGQFNTPDKVAALSDDQLHMSFVGRPLEM